LRVGQVYWLNGIRQCLSVEGGLGGRRRRTGLSKRRNATKPKPKPDSQSVKCWAKAERRGRTGKSNFATDYYHHFIVPYCSLNVNNNRKAIFLSSFFTKTITQYQSSPSDASFLHSMHGTLTQPLRTILVLAISPKSTC
jgi:hypothetical protein